MNTHRKHGTVVLSLLLAIVLSGCVAPLPVALASLAVTGVSVAFTGKGMMEHAVSDLSGRDCAVLHMLEGEALCASDENANFAPAIAASSDGAGETVNLTVASGPTSPGEPTWRPQGGVVAPGMSRIASMDRMTPGDPRAPFESDPLWRYMMARVTADFPATTSPLAEPKHDRAGNPRWAVKPRIPLGQSVELAWKSPSDAGGNLQPPWW